MKNFIKIFIVKIPLSIIFLLLTSACLKQVIIEEEPEYIVRVEIEGDEVAQTKLEK